MKQTLSCHRDYFKKIVWDFSGVLDIAHPRYLLTGMLFVFGSFIFFKVTSLAPRIMIWLHRCQRRNLEEHEQVKHMIWPIHAQKSERTKNCVHFSWDILECFARPELRQLSRLNLSHAKFPVVWWRWYYFPNYSRLTMGISIYLGHFYINVPSWRYGNFIHNGETTTSEKPFLILNPTSNPWCS